MSNPKIHQAEIGGVKYNIVEASAMQQKTLMSLIAGKIAFNSATSQHEINDKFLIGTLITTPEGDLDKIAEIVLHQTIMQNGSEKVTVDNFQGSMMAYYQLLAEAIAVNLQDFFTYLDSENQHVKAESKPSQ